MFKSYFLLQYFEKFAIFILELKKKIESQELNQALINQTQKQIIFFIESLKNQLLINNQIYTMEAFNNINYYLLIFADEMFLLNSSPEFKELWFANLLEKKFYNSSVAGNAIVLDIERFLNNISSNVETKLIVFFMISLGFKNNFNEEEVKEIKCKLYSNIYLKDPTLNGEYNHLIHGEYKVVETNFNENIYDTYQNLLKYIGIFSFLYFILSHSLWSVHLEGISSLLNNLR